MIAFLRGRLMARGADWVEVDVGGIGFHAAVSTAAAASLPAPGVEVTLPTVLVVREDGVALFAFADDAERRAFRALTAITGVGARTALGVLSVLRPEALVTAVHEGDADALTRAPGVGRKTAQRLLLELRERLAAAGLHGVAAPARGEPPVSGVREEAAAALHALGYSKEEAAEALSAVRAGAAADTAGGTATLVRAALGVLAGRVGRR